MDNSEYELDRTKLVRELTAAELLKLLGLKFTSLEYALKETKSPLYDLYLDKLNSLKANDEGYQYLLRTIKEVENSKNQ